MANQPVCSITTESYRDLPVIRVVGDVDLATSPDLRAALLDAGFEPGAGLIVDMTAVTFLDSTGLSALIAGHKQFADAGGALRIVIDAPHILRVLQVTGLDEALVVFPSLGAAASDAADLSATSA